MLNQPSITLSGQTVQLFYPLSGERFFFSPEHPGYDAVKACLHDSGLSVEGARQLYNRETVEQKSVESYTQGRVHFDGVDVLYKGKVLCTEASKAVKHFFTHGLPIMGLMNFIDRIYQNPSAWAVDSLFPFLVKRELAILDDGSVVGYKAITHDWLDKWTRKIDYSVGGSVPRVERNEVDDNRERACSFGYHIGSFGYACSYGGSHGDRLILAHFYPEDVCSVPSDAIDCNKLRVCWFEVLREIPRDKLENLAYSNESLAEPHPELPREQEPMDEEPWGIFGIKPQGGVQAGRKYHNRRGPNGRFA